MKKFISILLLLAITCSFTACNSTNKYVERAKENKYLSVFNTSWGMSVDECLDALKLKKDDIKLEPHVYSEEEGDFATYESFTVDKELFDKKAKVRFEFMYVVAKEYDMGLRMVSVAFDETITREFADAEVVKFIESQNLSFKSANRGPIPYYMNNESLSTLKDEKLQADITQFKKEYWYDDEIKLDPSANESTIFSKSVIGSLDEIYFLAAEFNDKPITEVASIEFSSSEAIFLSNVLDKRE